MESDYAWSETTGGLAIDLRFQKIPERFVLGEWRPPHLRRRHHAGAQFPDHFLPQLLVIADRGKIQIFKRKIGRFSSIVVARDTVLIEKRALSGPPLLVRSGSGGT